MLRVSFDRPDPPDHVHHFCTRKESTKVVETYSCGSRRVYNEMAGTCCMCQAIDIFWSEFYVREPGEPDQKYGVFTT